MNLGGPCQQNYIRLPRHYPALVHYHDMKSPQDKAHDNGKCNASWSIGQPMEELWDRLEEVVCHSPDTKLPYTVVSQPLIKTKTAITLMDMSPHDTLK